MALINHTEYLSMKMYCKNITTLLLASLLFFYSFTVLALPEDRDQPIEIIADSAVKDDKLGTTIYSGNVSITQGSLNILADKVTIFVVNEQATKIVAVGKPARLKQQPKPEEKDVVAKANTIDYLIVEEKITLISNASLNQDGSNIKGQTITYDIKGAKSKAEGGVTVTVQPAKTKK